MESCAFYPSAAIFHIKINCEQGRKNGGGSLRVGADCGGLSRVLAGCARVPARVLPPPGSILLSRVIYC